ncbi:MAG TPA: outer-membrane lipoprotein carrier protein LolA [Patescibacteria group bacterium]|nr:outer-membrane lipoprotein carrier protein LolA [Patescibacteria group bacterium]
MKQRGTFIAFWLLASLLQASAADDFLQRVRDKILNSQPFKTDFIQQVFIDEEKILEESGVIIFADRSRVKWEYLNPEAKTFILQDGRYSFYDRENNQLMRGRIGARSEQLIWELLFSDRPGNASSWDAQQRTIRLRLDGEGGVQELKIKVGTDYLPERVEQTAVNEVTTVYLFRNYRRRITISPGEFDLALPVDVEIIEE